MKNSRNSLSDWLLMAILALCTVIFLAVLVVGVIGLVATDVSVVKCVIVIVDGLIFGSLNAMVSYAFYQIMVTPSPTE